MRQTKATASRADPERGVLEAQGYNPPSFRVCQDRCGLYFIMIASDSVQRRMWHLVDMHLSTTLGQD